MAKGARAQVWPLHMLVDTDVTEVVVPEVMGEVAGCPDAPAPAHGEAMVTTDTGILMGAMAAARGGHAHLLPELLARLPEASHDALMARRCRAAAVPGAREAVEAAVADGVGIVVWSPMTCRRTRDVLLAAGYDVSSLLGRRSPANACMGLAPHMAFGLDQLAEDLAHHDVTVICDGRSLVAESEAVAKAVGGTTSAPGGPRASDLAGSR